ncbi:putative Ulp1 protease family catalytic domain, papain-like cysteine peptidase superfamily [Arabidopsis thaliana]
MTDIEDVKKWSEKKDIIRFVYICVIAGLVMATSETKKIDHLYIKMVMDLHNVRNYPWGLKAYDNLLNCIMKAIYALKKTKSYVLDGFSYTLQIWVMEAIPNIGSLLGEKISTEFNEGPRCSNWKGAAKISYENIISVDGSFKSHAVFYPSISYSGNEVINDREFVWRDEIRDGEVDNMIEKIKSRKDFRDHVWESVVHNQIEGDNIENVQENDVQGKDDVTEDGNEVDHMSGVTEEGNEENHVSGMKRSKKKQFDHGAETRKKKLLCQRATATTHGALNDKMNSFLKALIDSSFEKFEKRLQSKEDDISLVEGLVSTSETTRKTTRFTTSQPSNPTDQPSKLIDLMSLDDDILDFNLGTQEFLDKSMGHLSQLSQLSGFDSTQNLDKYIPDVDKNDKDAVLVFVSEARWEAFREWDMKHDKALLGRLLTSSKWLGNEDMDATMYLFREKSSIGRLNLARVGLLDCIFGVRLNVEYKKFAFAITVPRILKEIHTKSNGKNLLLAPYTLVHVLVPPDLNKTCCDCGVYALKYIECHFMGLSLDMLDDVNIKDARLRIAVDLWKAAFDPVFIDRMTKYKPPKINSEIIDIA